MSGRIKVEDFIKNVSKKKLREFIVNQAKCSGELRNAVFLEFAANVKKRKYNKYSSIIREVLESVDFSNKDIYIEDCLFIDGLTDWLEKAKNCIRLKQYDEAILISKAFIEEYSQWMSEDEDDVRLVFFSGYQSVPFNILEEASKYIDKKELLDYCLTEMKKKKYVDSDYHKFFHELLGNITDNAAKTAGQ